MTEKKCCVHGCKNKLREAWIDVADHEKGELICARLSFCDPHYDKVMSYIKKKEKEMQEKEKKEHPNGIKLKDGTIVSTSFWAYAPLKYVNEALNQ